MVLLMWGAAVVRVGDEGFSRNMELEVPKAV